MTKAEFIKYVEEQTGEPFEDRKVVKIVDHDPSSFESLGKGNWGVYEVTVKMDDGSEKNGFVQGDTHSWALETFEEI